jgi:hypothetical protein
VTTRLIQTPQDQPKKKLTAKEIKEKLEKMNEEILRQKQKRE